MYIEHMQRHLYFFCHPLKIAVPFILVTAIGWLLVVVGFAIAINKE